MKKLLLILLGCCLMLPALSSAPQQNSGMIIVVQSNLHWRIENQRKVAVEVNINEKQLRIAPFSERFVEPPTQIPPKLYFRWTDGLSTSVNLQTEDQSPPPKSQLP